MAHEKKIVVSDRMNVLELGCKECGHHKFIMYLNSYKAKCSKCGHRFTMTLIQKDAAKKLHAIMEEKKFKKLKS